MDKELVEIISELKLLKDDIKCLNNKQDAFDTRQSHLYKNVNEIGTKMQLYKQKQEEKESYDSKIVMVIRALGVAILSLVVYIAQQQISVNHDNDVSQQKEIDDIASRLTVIEVRTDNWFANYKTKDGVAQSGNNQP